MHAAVSCSGHITPKRSRRGSGLRGGGRPRRGAGLEKNLDIRTRQDVMLRLLVRRDAVYRDFIARSTQCHRFLDDARIVQHTVVNQGSNSHV